MAGLQIEGTLDTLRDVQIQFVRDVLENRGYTDNKVIIKPASACGDNYAANVTRITVVVEDGDDFKIIGKFAPDNEIIRQTLNTGNMFNNEIVMYEEVLPKLVSLQIAAEVPKEDLLRYAECYGCLAEEPNEVILLEDLKESDFVMLDRMSSLSDDAVRLILKNFAILHSLSYVLKEKEPDTYDRFRNKLIDMWNIKSEEIKMYTTQLEADAIELFDGDKYKNALRGLVSRSSDFSLQLKKAEQNSKHLVIQLGDSWTNNIMFKLKGDVPSECIMIDYQLARETNPLCDILYMVFNCTDHITRSNHYLNWINFYHDQLDRSLSDFGMKANFIYPRDQLDADLKRYSKMFFGLAVMINSILSRTPKEAAEINETMKQDEKTRMENETGVNTLSNNTLQLYKSRIQDLVDSYLLFGFL